MSVVWDTSHSPIGPCGPVEQSPTGDSFRHAWTASLRSPVFFGENVVPANVVVRCCNEKGGTQGFDASFKYCGVHPTMLYWDRTSLPQWTTIATKQSQVAVTACIWDTYCKMSATCIPWASAPVYCKYIQASEAIKRKTSYYARVLRVCFAWHAQ